MPYNESESFNDKLADETSTLGNAISESAAQVKGRVSELGRRAADKIDQNLGTAATGLDKAAATLHARAENLPGVDKVSGLTHAAADRLSSTADYLREHDVDRMVGDLKTLVKNNPVPSLIAAGVLGFLVARAFRSSNNV